MKRTLVLLICFSLLISLALTACSQASDDTHLGQMRRDGKMVVGTSADYPPFEWVNEDGDFAGFDIELIQEIGRRLELEVEIRDIPFDQLVTTVEENELDLAISAFNYTEERDEKVDFTEPYYSATDAVLVSDTFVDIINGAVDLARYDVGVQMGTTQESWVVENLLDTGDMADEQLHNYERIDEAVDDLQAGEIDALLLESVVALSLIEERGDMYVGYVGELSSGPMSIIVPDGDEELRAALDDVIVELQEEGFIDELVIEYMK